MKRIVVKFGTGILSTREGRELAPDQFTKLINDVIQLISEGLSCIIVTSGAIAAGMPLLGLNERPSEIASQQACAAIGQPVLMRMYDRYFSPHGLHPAQLLLSHYDIDSQMRRQNASCTLEKLLACRRVVPIINENDSVAVEELRVGDNDRLSAEVAVLAHADLLIILTTVDGLLSDQKVIPEVIDLNSAAQLVTGETGRLSVGGMRTKLDAVRIARQAGIPTIIASGLKSGILPGLVRGESHGTRFPIPALSEMG